MYRTSVLIVLIFLTFFILSSTNGKNLTNRKRPISSTHKPVSIKICGTALVRMLDMICSKARQLLMKNDKSSTPEKRQMLIDDDPYTRTLSITDYAQFNDTLVGDCCLQACTLKTLLKYC